MKTIIVNTFSFISMFPSYNTAYIQGLLKKNNEESKNIDINQIIWNELLSKEFISNLKFNSDINKIQKCPLCSYSILSKESFDLLKEEILQNIDDVISIFRSNEIYIFEKLKFAYTCVHKLQCLIYASFGTFFTFHMPYWAGLGFECSDVEAIYKIASDIEKNPLIEIIEKKVVPIIRQNEVHFIIEDIMFPWDIIPALTFNKIIKKEFPNVHINYAGLGFDEFSFSRIKQGLISNSKLFFLFDSIFIYRNEKGIVELLRGEKMDEIDNLYYINNGDVITNRLNESILNDKNIIPIYDDIDFNKFFVPEKIVIDRLTYKCFWSKCNFCSINSNKFVLQKGNLDEHVQRVVQIYNKYGVNNFWFLDEACPIKYAESFASKICESGISIYWSLRTRIDKRIKKDVLIHLYNSGLRELWLGLEHVNYRILELMNKSDFNMDYGNIASKILKDASDIGIGIHFCHIVGFPSETDEEREDILNFYKRNLTSLKRMPFFTTFNVFGLMYESVMYKNPKKFGLYNIKPDDNTFFMIKVPYNSKYNDETCNPVNMIKLGLWISKYTDAIVPSKGLQAIWNSISDSPMELLLKKHYRYNPFI